MKRTGITALAATAVLTMQGCMFAPYDNENSYDPFFYNPDDKSESADFLEVGNYQPNSQLPPAASRRCSVEAESSKIGSPCWFFPVMKVY